MIASARRDPSAISAAGSRIVPKTPLPPQQGGELRVVDEIPFRQAAGIVGETPQPFQSGPLHPQGRPTHETDGELGRLPEQQYGRLAAELGPSSAVAADRR